MEREIVITGANGWVGGYAGIELARRGWRVTGVSRTPEEARERRPEWSWVGVDGDALERAVERTGAVLNLAGRHVLEQRWDHEYVQEMRDSRLAITRRVVAALRRSSASQRVLASASGYPIYGDVGEDPVSEDRPVFRELVSGAMDDDWEREANAADDGTTRVALLGSSRPRPRRGRLPRAARAVPCRDGRRARQRPAMDAMGPRRRRGAPDRRHRRRDDYQGPVNLVAPQPARHAEFAAALAAALGATGCSRVPAEQVEAMLGGAAELLLTSQRMTPTSALRHGFLFDHADVASAVKNLLTGP